MMREMKSFIITCTHFVLLITQLYTLYYKNTGKYERKRYIE